MTPEELTAVEEIRRLKARYFRTLDAKDWDGYAAVFTDDVEVHTPDDGGAEPVVGVDAYLSMLRGFIEDVVTVHHGHMGEIDITGPDTAIGTWAMEDHLWWPPGTGMGHMWGTGWYEETYRRADGAWRIATLRLRRIRVEVDGVRVFPPGPGG